MTETSGKSNAVRQRLPLRQICRLAEARRAAGRLDEAERLLVAALAHSPDTAPAIHLLGIIAHQRGRTEEAIGRLRRATALAPRVPLFHASLGEMCLLAGRRDEAMAASERALALEPQNVAAHNTLGIAHCERGEYAAAIARYERAIALKPETPQLHGNLANALRALKRYEEAAQHYRRALDLAPDSGAAWNNLAVTLRALKRFAEAEAAGRRAVALNGDDPETLNNLALCLKDLERFAEAEALLRRSLAIDADNAQTNVYLGLVLLLQHRPEAAGRCERAAALAPDHHATIKLRGHLAFERGELAAAEAWFRRALALEPGFADDWNNLGNVLKVAGRLDEARDAYRRSLAIDPDGAGVYLNYADLTKFAADDRHLRAMESLAEAARPLSDTARMHLDFALGKAYADFGDYRRSFRHLARGNAAKRRRISYDEATELRAFDRIAAIFTPALLHEKEKLACGAGDGGGSPVPIIVFGIARSGTTLVEQILASHPRVFGAGELQHIDRLAGKLRGPDGARIPYPEFVPALERQTLRRFGARYRAELERLAPGARYVTDKALSNYLYAGLIHLALPEARLVHVMRDPLDTCVSCFSKLFTDEQSHTYDLAELGRYYRRYQRLMEHWRRVLPPGRMLELRYEEVIADLDGTARRLLAYCGLEWDARCLAFHATERPVSTASAAQVRQPLYDSAIGRWNVYAESLGPLIEALAEPPAVDAD